MRPLALSLTLASVLYVVYALSVFSQSKSEVSSTLARFPKHWLLTPVRLLLWVLFLPMSNTAGALLLALMMFVSGAVLFAL